jgi:hypothetical protein
MQGSANPFCSFSLLLGLAFFLEACPVAMPAFGLDQMWLILSSRFGSAFLLTGLLHSSGHNACVR